jgi:dTDP-4-amino-4,6-dideoxygalactose transaminase
MIPYGRQEISEEDIQAVINALRSDLITTGPLVDEFENELEKVVGASCVVLNSGTAALQAAYYGAGLKKGDEILTPANTFVATQAAAIHLGLKVKFVDIDLETGLISLDDLKRKLSRNTKAIVVVDYAGQPVDISAVRSIVGDRSVWIIEDAAHSLGSRFEKLPVGSIADITTFSFYPTKNITTGEGGAVSSKNLNVIQRAKLYSRQGLVRTPNKFVLKPDGPWHQEVHFFGHNYRLTDFQCALGLSQLKRLSHFKSYRENIYKYYVNLLKGVEEVNILKVDSRAECVWHLMPVKVPKPKRKSVFERLRAAGIGVQVNYVPAYHHPAFRTKRRDFLKYPNSEEFYASEISLPIFVGITKEQVEFVCDELLNALKMSKL